MAIFAATRRPLIQSAAFANFPLSVPPPPPQRSCHGKSYIPGHWQSPNSCTSVESALKREARGTAEASLFSAHSRSSPRARTTRASATKGTSGDGIPALPLATAPAAEHAAAHPPSPPSDERDGSPGASSSGVSGSRDGSVAAPVGVAQAAVEALKAELQDMRKQVAAQAALTAQQALTISSLERALQKTRDGASANSTQGWNADVRPFDAQRSAIGDRRYLGGFDARFHSTSQGATPKDYRVLPPKIILVRHAESEGNVDNFAYTYVPDPQVPLTEKGKQQALGAGQAIRAMMEQDGNPYNLFFYTSPYKRSRQTFEEISKAIDPAAVIGAQEEVQLREQDFGNFQDAEGKEREKTERLRFGRFWYRFPHGESGADVYDRMTIFEDHMIRDINAGRFSNNTSLVLVTHGLALRIFLMRFFHWTVDQFLEVFNPPNAVPLVLERVPGEREARAGGPVSWLHTKALYKLSSESRSIMRGCSSDMCSAAWVPDGVALRESSQRSIDGARQLQRSNVVEASPLRKKSTAAATVSNE